MKKFTLLLPLVSLALCSQISAQTESLRNFPSFEPTRHIRLDVSTSYQKGSNLNMVQITKFRNIDKNKMFNVGAGFRLNNLNFTNQLFESKGSNSSGITNFIASGFTVGVNFLISAEFNWNNKWGIGVNTDLAGFAFGIPQISDQYNVKKGVLKDKEPTPYNLGPVVPDVNFRTGMRTGSGILSSEIFGVYKITRKLWIKAGYSRLNADVLLRKMEEKYGYSSNLFSLGARITY